MWTDLEVPAEMDRIEALLRQETQEVDAARALDPRGEAQPIVLDLDAGLLDRLRPIELIVAGRAGDVAVVERRALLPRLPPGASAVAIPLEARCAGRGCDPGWTCIRGACERADLPAEALATTVDDLPPDPLAALVAGRPVDGCVSGDDCEDGDPCTINPCVDHHCEGDGWAGDCIPCLADEDCARLAEGRPCLAPFCHEYGVCRVHTRPPGTRCDDDDNPCTVQCCREATECMTFDVCAEPDVPTGCDP